MKINIAISMPEQVQEGNKHQDICSKCEDYMLTCESDKDSEYHFRYLGAIYKKLSSMKKVPENLTSLLAKLEDFMLKYDIDHLYLDSANMFKGKPESGE